MSEWRRRAGQSKCRCYCLCDRLAIQCRSHWPVRRVVACEGHFKEENGESIDTNAMNASQAAGSIQYESSINVASWLKDNTVCADFYMQSLPATDSSSHCIRIFNPSPFTFTHYASTRQSGQICNLTQGREKRPRPALLAWPMENFCGAIALRQCTLFEETNRTSHRAFIASSRYRDPLCIRHPHRWSSKRYPRVSIPSECSCSLGSHVLCHCSEYWALC